MGNAHICLIEDSELQMFKLKAILVRLGYTVTAHASPLKALEWLESNSSTVNLILSDVIMPEMNGIELVRKLKTNPATAQIPILLLTATAEMKDKIAGLQAGADEYLLKTVSPTELELRIQALLSRKIGKGGTLSQSVSRTIAVFSLRGGVGTTTIAVNLSIALPRDTGGQVILWDMALLTGHCALMLDLKARNTITSLSDWDEDSVEDKVVANMLIKHESGIKLLPAPSKPSEAELITTKSVDLIWPYLQGNSSYIVVDAGNHFTDPVLAILERADTILLVLSPELASVKSAIDAIRIFEEMGFAREKVVPVVNHIFPAHYMLMNKISQVLGNRDLLEIPYDSPAVIQAINLGKPIVMTSPNSEMSQAFVELAGKFIPKTAAPLSHSV